MRVIVEVLSGPDVGRKTLLGAGQVVRVGRTEWADFTVAHNGHMSSVHFALETDDVACYIRDLGSSNGTLLNGQPVTERTVLHDGDEIRAGETRFLIRTEGDAPEKAEISASQTPAAGTAAAGRIAAGAVQGSPKVTYTVEMCNSGLTLCRGSVDEIQPADLAALISQTVPLYLIVDFNNLGIPLPEDLEQPHYLFDWFDPEAAATASPVVLSQSDSVAWPTLVAEGWGNDAVICLFATQDQSALLEHLHHALQAKPKRDNQSGGMIGYCWPSVMAMLLSHNTPSFVRQLLTGIDAVLVELPDLPETWQVYGESRVADVLDGLGFVRQPPEQIPSRQPEDQT